MTQHIEVVNPSDPAYGKVHKAVENSNERRAAIDYEDLARRYNASEVGAIIILRPTRKVRINNVCSALKRRGLIKGEDFKLTRLFEDSNGNPLEVEKRPLALEILSETPIRI